MALAHHQASHGDQNRGCKSELLRTEQGADHDIASGLELSVDLYADAVAELVQAQSLLGFGKADFPREPGVLDAGERACSGSAVVSADENHIRMTFCNARGNRSDAEFGNELHGNARLRVCVAEIEDQLGKVFDRVDVMVRRRRDQRHAWGGVTDTGDEIVDLVSGKLAALARFCALGDLDLKFLCVREVFRRNAETSGSDLLDCAGKADFAWLRHITRRIFAAFTGVAHAAEFVHGAGDRGVSFRADRAVGHCARHETLDNFGCAFDFLKRNRRGLFEFEESAQSADAVLALVDELGVLFEFAVVVVADRLLKQSDGLRSPQMALAVLAELVLTAGGEQIGLSERFAAGGVHAESDFVFNLLQTDAADTGGGSGEVFGNQLGAESDGLEQLGAAETAEGRDALFGHDLAQSLADCVNVISGRRGGIEFDLALLDEFGNRFESEVRIDCGRAVAEQQSEMHDFAGVACFQNHARTAADSGGKQTRIDGGGGKQRRNRAFLVREIAVAQNDDVPAFANRFFRFRADGFKSLFKSDFRRIRDLDGLRAEIRKIQIAKPSEILIGENRLLHLHEMRMFRRLLENVAVVADVGHQRHDGSLADRVDRRVRHLGEQLFEVVVKNLRLFGEHGERGVIAHRADGFLSVLRHGGDQNVEIFAGVAEEFLSAGDVVTDRGWRRLVEKAVDGDAVFLNPAAVRLETRDLRFDFRVVADAPVFEVEVDHLSGTEASMFQHGAGRDVEHAGFRSENEGAVGGNGVAGGTQSGAVEHGSGVDAVGKRDGGGTVPRLHDRGMIFEEPADVLSDMVILAPGLRHEHQHGVRQRAAAFHKKFKRVVQRSRVALSVRNDGDDFLDVFAEQRGFQHRFTRSHVIEIAADRVDFTVVREIAERVGERPGREGVRAVTLVDNRKRALEVFACQIRVELGNLMREKQSFVNNGAGREAHDIGTAALEVDFGGFLLENLADDVEVALEFILSRTLPAEKNLLDDRHRCGGRLSDFRRVGRNVAPCEHGETFALAGVFKERGSFGKLRRSRGQKEHCNRVFACGWQNGGKLFFTAEEFIGNVRENARAVTGLGVVSGCAAVRETAQRLNAHFHDAVRLAVVKVGNQTDAARIVFLFEVVESLPPWEFGTSLKVLLNHRSILPVDYPLLPGI